MEYKTIFWTHSSDSSIVFQLPKKIIRIMTGSKPRDSCNTIFQTLEILTVPSQYFCGRSPSEIVGRIPPGAWMCCLLCVLSGTGLCDRLISRPEESYRLWHVVVCDQETSRMRRLKPTTGLWKIQPHRVVMPRKQTKQTISIFTIPDDFFDS